MDSSRLRDLALDTTTWRHYRFEEPYRHEGKVALKHVRGDFYEKEIDGTLCSYGTFTYRSLPTHRAWGVKADPHCSFHSVYQEGKWGPPQDGCPPMLAILRAHGARRALLTVRKFLPLAAMFALTLVATLLYELYRGPSVHGAVMGFMAFYFLLFGALKVVNLSAFVRSYRGYDALAKESTGYAYAYPFIEIALGGAFLTGMFLAAASALTLALMAQKAWSVLTKLREGKEVTCACLGGFFSIPVTWFTFVEDAGMALMAAWMLAVLAG